MLDITNFEPRQSKLHNPGTGKTGETFGYDLYKNQQLRHEFVLCFTNYFAEYFCQIIFFHYLGKKTL